MYINAAKRATGLESYVGKDIWIRAHIYDPNCFAYIKLLSCSVGEYNTTNYTLNYIPLQRISKTGICYCTQQQMDFYTSNTKKVSEYDIEILKPLECVATDELFEIEEDEG